MNFFEFVEGSQRAACRGADVLFQRRVSGQRIVKTAAMSGVSYEPEQVFCTFQLRIKADASGSGYVRCSNAKAADAAYQRADVATRNLAVSLSARPAADALGTPVRERNRVRVFCQTGREEAKLLAAFFLPTGQLAAAVLEDAPPVSGEVVLTFQEELPEEGTVNVFLVDGNGMIPLCRA